MRIIYGTTNQEKINQVKAFFEAQGRKIDIISLKEIGFDEEIIENGKTFEENSKIKAEQIKKYCDKNGIKEIIVTDDTGLCVDSLDGRPGVLSARYAGDHAKQETVIEKLLNEMKNVEPRKRTAKFECAITAIMPDGEVLQAKGKTFGMIPIKPGKLGKLTYGPVFVAEGFDRPLSEVDEKYLGRTHREKAFLEILSKIEEKTNVRKVKINGIYRHFKGDYYIVLDIAQHSETKEKYVVYKGLYGNVEVYIRPYDMFLSKVDKEKYPNETQEYRFELQEIEKRKYPI